MCETYLDQINEEFDRLGVGEPTVTERFPWPPTAWSHFEILRLVDRTYVHADVLAEIADAPQSEVETYPALQAAAILNHGQRPEEVKYHTCCGGAEYKLIENLDDASIANIEFASPLILTKDGQAVGIIKGFGEDSFYGLVDDPDFGIVKSAFATPLNRHDMKPLSAASHAWQAPIEALGPVAPLRLSLFSIPIEERLQFAELDSEEDRTCMRTTHENIVSTAERLLRDAVAVEVLAS